MSSPTSEFRDAFARELARLGLDLRDLPGLAIEAGGEAALLARLRALAPGATWHDVLPTLPASFVPGQLDTWVTPYRPLGPFDYPTPPASPAVHVTWRVTPAPDALEQLVAEARAAGVRIYGAGAILDGRHAFVVLERGVDEDEFGAFLSWLETHPTAELAVITRDGTEQYAE